MTGFDPELYLRLCAEDILLSGGDDGWNDSLVEHARALVAVDAVAPDVAAGVITEYARAQRLRGRHRHMMRYRVPPLGGRDELSAVQPLAPRRVAQCDRAIEHPWGTAHIEWVILTPDETRVCVTVRADTTKNPAPAQPAGRGPHPTRHGFGHHQLPSISITDDRGTSVSTTFSSGDGSDIELNAVYTADTPLHRSTRWLEVMGERIDLADDYLDVAVDVEPIDDSDPAGRYLQHRLLVANQHGVPDSLRTGIQALVASGALAPQSPLVAETLRIEQLRARDFQGDRGDDLPQPWRSLCQRRQRRGGPIGALYFGAATPVFDGVSVAINGLQSSDDGFRVRLETTGAPSRPSFGFDLDEARLAFTASDDCGDFYLGELSSYESSDSHLSGEVEYNPPLNPQATQLDISVSTGRSRAVFHVPLRWSGK